MKKIVLALLLAALPFAANAQQFWQILETPFWQTLETPCQPPANLAEEANYSTCLPEYAPYGYYTYGIVWYDSQLNTLQTQALYTDLDFPRTTVVIGALLRWPSSPTYKLSAWQVAQ